MFSKEWFLGLIGFGKRKAPPIIIRGVRSGGILLLTFITGFVTTELAGLDWEEFGVVGMVVNGGWQLLLEGPLDQYRNRKDWT